MPLSGPLIGKVASSLASISPSSVTSLCRPTILSLPVELAELGDGAGLAGGDLVEDVLHAGGELVVDLPGEVLLQQAHHREAIEAGTRAAPFS